MRTGFVCSLTSLAPQKCPLQVNTIMGGGRFRGARYCPSQRMISVHCGRWARTKIQYKMKTIMFITLMAAFIFYVPFFLKRHIIADFARYGFKSHAEMESFHRACRGFIKRAQELRTVQAVYELQRSFDQHMLHYFTRNSKHIQKHLDDVCKELRAAKTFAHRIESMRNNIDTITLKNGKQIFIL